MTNRNAIIVGAIFMAFLSMSHRLYGFYIKNVPPARVGDCIVLSFVGNQRIPTVIKKDLKYKHSYVVSMQAIKNMSLNGVYSYKDIRRFKVQGASCNAQ